MTSADNHKSEIESTGRGLNEFLPLGIALFFAAAVYAATLQFAFAYDDQTQILGNAFLRYWRFVPGYFRGKWLEGAASANYYRPLNFVWLRINYALFGTHAMGWHAMAILLHLLATFLIYSVARRVTQRRLAAGLTALFFAVHPVTHEVVAWISGTTESLWTVFALGAFLCYLRFRDGDGSGWLIGSCGLCAAGMLSKETAIMFPALVFAHAWIYGGHVPQAEQVSFGRRTLGAIKAAAYYVPIAVVYLAIRMSVLHGFSHPLQQLSKKAFLLTLPSIAFFYFKQWMFPIHLTEFYELPISSSFNLMHVLLPITGLFLIAVVLWLIRRRLGSREIAFAVAWMLLPLLPVFDFVVFPQGDMVHDRYFYLPSFGAALLLALTLEKLAHGPRVFGIHRRLLFPVLGLVLILSYDTAKAASYWRDNFTLFQHCYQLASHTTAAQVDYAVALTSRGQYGEAIPLFEQVLREHPNNYLATYGLGQALYELGLLKPAEHFFLQTVQLNPQKAGTYLHLGLIEMKTGRVDDAVNDMRRGLALAPLDAEFHFALGMALQAQGSCKESRSELQATLELQADLPHAKEQIDKCVSTSAAATQSGRATVAAAPSPTIGP
jgi:tetratricopeptide (TPR) repeat protein